MKTILKKGILILTGWILFVMCLIPASANSGITEWTGYDETGVQNKDEDCPLVITHEDLIFEPGTFPESYYKSSEEFLALDGTVTAVYQIHNPENYDVTATLVFPYGSLPAYAPYYDGGLNTASPEFQNRYAITLNGQEVRKVLRCTYNPDNNALAEMVQISDERTQDDWFREDLTVTLYRYVIRSEGSVLAAMTFPQETRALASDTMWIGEKGIEWWFKNDGSTEHTAEFYVLGDPLQEEPEWKFLNAPSKEKEVEGSAEFAGSETMTLEDLIFRNYDSSWGIPETDWYNAWIAYLQEAAESPEWNGVNPDETFGSGRNLMQWFEYTIEVKAGQTVTNTVQAPLYPTVNEFYEPPVYRYRYLFSPASTWKEFGDIDVSIVTDQYLIFDKAGLFEKTDNGYECHYDTLPSQDLEFNLCTVTSPDTNSYGKQMGLLIFGVMGGALILFVLLVVLIIKLVKRFSKNRE